MIRRKCNMVVCWQKHFSHELINYIVGEEKRKSNESNDDKAEMVSKMTNSKCSHKITNKWQGSIS